MTTRLSPGDAPHQGTVIASLTNGNPWTRPLSGKVPEASLPFWVLTTLATTVGATGGDFLSANLGLGLGLGMSATTAIMSLVVAGTLIWQLSTARYVPGLYWCAVVLVSVLGTLVSDDLVDNLGVSLWAATAIFGALLAAVLTSWLGSAHTVSVHAVLTRRREACYWCAVLCAFSLGTAMGDLISGRLGLGHATAVLVLGGAMAMITLAHRSFRLNAVAAFWAAYVVACPFGDSIGDLLTAAPSSGGLGLSTDATSSAVLVVMLVVVGLSTAGAHRSAARVTTLRPDPPIPPSGPSPGAGRSPSQSGAGQVRSPTVLP